MDGDKKSRGDPRILVLERLRDPDTARCVTDSLLDALQGGNLKPTEAANTMKIVDWISNLVKEADAESASEADLSNLDFSQYSDEELRSMLLRLTDAGDGPENKAEQKPVRSGAERETDGQPDERRQPSPSGGVRIRLDDYLYG
ncbi:MAG: hypothetical protein IJT94_09075 [Oscillibacter sp.]|nr:hypothetical protein [Oscillibacter sp.]